MLTECPSCLGSKEIFVVREKGEEEDDIRGDVQPCPLCKGAGFIEVEEDDEKI